jgi:4-amino-4-deoxy-L-arabinose transferase-like glycosyltransferase
MSRVAVPNLATDWKARVGAAVLALAIGLVVALATGDLGMSAIVLGGSGILISLVRFWQERATRSQAPQGQASDSK